MNTFGHLYRLTSFGESHGTAIGGVIDGCPSCVEIDFNAVQMELERRRPGQSQITTQRKEKDLVQFLSGIYEGRTTGTPIGFLVRNENQRSHDYDELEHVFRPSHADFTYQMKYGIRDPKGGGRSSARETITRCVAGAIAKQILASQGIRIAAYTSQIGGIKLEKSYYDYDLTNIDANPVRCPDADKAVEMEKYIVRIKGEGDTTGGVVTCVISGVPVGLGEPVFGKLNSELAAAMLSINAAKGFEIGGGFAMAAKKGSEVNDSFAVSDGTIYTETNNSGGVQGGISNGEDIYFNVAFKPVATLLRKQWTVNDQGQPIIIKAKGRHDPCVVPRAVPIVENMAAMVILDHLLLYKAYK